MTASITSTIIQHFRILLYQGVITRRNNGLGSNRINCLLSSQPML
jgi:hypothetical protein